MSALPPKADIGTQPRDVRFVPKADICGAAKRPTKVGLLKIVDLQRPFDLAQCRAALIEYRYWARQGSALLRDGDFEFESERGSANL